MELYIPVGHKGLGGGGEVEEAVFTFVHNLLVQVFRRALTHIAPSRSFFMIFWGASFLLK